jgi:1,4-alpha-glucan branching enzyme
MALHKMIRLISQSLGGQAYLNFMGNEFGHPEWIDFPREGNNDSFKYCRRQWNLQYDADLRYGSLAEFDKVMNHTEMKFNYMESEHQYVSLNNDEDKVIVYEKGDLLFIFNFHGNKSYSDYDIGTFWKSDHFILFDSDEERFDGHRRLDDAHGKWIKPVARKTNERPYTLRLYLPSRCCIVLCPYEAAQSKTFGIPEMPKILDSDNLMNDVKGSQPVTMAAQKPQQTA